MLRKLMLTFTALIGVLASTCAFAGGLEQSTSDGNKPAAESGGSGR